MKDQAETRLDEARAEGWNAIKRVDEFGPIRIRGPKDRQHMRLLLAARQSKKVEGVEALGIETQDQRAREWGARQGHVIIGVAADTVRGTVAPYRRKNLKAWWTKPELMQHYEGILAHTNARLSRGAWEDETEIRRWAHENGKVLVIADGPQWPPRDDGDSWAWEANAKQARREWEEIQERTTRARQELRERGKNVNRLPWGYVSVGTYKDHNVATTSQGRQYAKSVFEKIANKQPLADVCRWMDEQGIRTNTRKPGKWDPRTLGRNIKNPIYYGSKQDAQGREIRTVAPPVLVDHQLWLDANDKLKTAPRGRRGPVNGNTALLTSVLFCLPCHRRGIESPMYRKRCKQGLYYRCAGTGPNPKGCGHRVRMEIADSIVSGYLSQAAAQWTYVEHLPGTSHEIERSRIRLAMRELASQDLTDDEYDVQLAKLRKERDAVPGDTEAHYETIHTGKTVGQHWESLDFDGKRQMLQEDVRIYIEHFRACWIETHQPALPEIMVRSRLFQPEWTRVN